MVPILASHPTSRMGMPELSKILIASASTYPLNSAPGVISPAPDQRVSLIYEAPGKYSSYYGIVLIDRHNKSAFNKIAFVARPEAVQESDIRSWTFFLIV